MNNNTGFGKYLLRKKLGEGAMGEVWLADDPELNRKVAVKFLKGAYSEEIARFKREASTVAGLSHKNIAQIYDIGEHDRRHYIAMQYVQGETLGDFAGHNANHKTLALLVRDAALALESAHAKGVVHRDIKPDNMMVEKDANGRLRVYVMDFGLARRPDDSSLSMTGTICGTPSYMSTEQARGEKLDRRSDVYSLGATLYHLLSGRAPFRGRTVVDTLRMVTDEDPRPITRIDHDLSLIVMKCLSKEKEHRYGTCRQLADDLKRWTKGEPVMAHPPSLGYTVRKFVRKWKLPLSIGAAALVLLTGTIIWGATRGPDEAAIAAEKEKTRIADEQKKAALRKAAEDKARAEEETKKAEEAEKRRQAEETARIEAEKAREMESKRLRAKQLVSESADHANGNGGPKNLQMAYDKANEAIKLDPLLASAYSNRGYALMRGNGPVPACRDDFIKAIELDPSKATYHNNLGTWYLYAREQRTAIKHLTRAIELDANYQYYMHRGCAYGELDMNKEAIADMRMVIKVAPPTINTEVFQSWIAAMERGELVEADRPWERR